MGVLATAVNISNYDSLLDYPILEPVLLVLGGAIGLWGIWSVFLSFVTLPEISRANLARNTSFIATGILTLWFWSYKSASFTLQATALIYLPTACSLHFLYVYFSNYREARNQAVKRTV